MDCKLIRTHASEKGIFGRLLIGDKVYYTCEHAYLNNEKWVAKAAAGHYVCERHEPNRLPYVTFMLRDVPPFQGHPVSGVLIHIGNFNKDSEGCILLGLVLDMAFPMVGQSKAAFAEFMHLQKDCTTFNLTIEDAV